MVYVKERENGENKSIGNKHFRESHAGQDDKHIHYQRNHIYAYLTFSRTRNKEVVQVIYNLPGVQIRVCAYRGRNADLRHGMEGGQPFAIDVHAVLDRLMVCKE